MAFSFIVKRFIVIKLFLPLWSNFPHFRNDIKKLVNPEVRYLRSCLCSVTVNLEKQSAANKLQYEMSMEE